MDIKPKSNLKEVYDESKDVLDIQRQIEKSVVDQNTALEKMIGFTRSLRTGVIQRFQRERALTKEVKSIEKQLQDQRKQTATLTDSALREESKLAEEGLQQRLTAYSKELEMLRKVNASALGPLLYFLTKSYELFRDMDKAAADFRKTMGFVRGNSEDIRKIAEKIAIDFHHVGVNIETAYGSVVALGSEIGSAYAVSAELVKTTSILKSQLGVSEESSAGFLRNMAAIAGSSLEAQKDMAYMAGHLSNAAGVPLPAIMKDIASKSNTTLTMISRVPAQVIRAAIELRKMGTDLERATKSSREILNFTDNINAEMEASVLLGHSINLQHARELAYRRDIAGSTKEILRLTKSINFENLDVFQQEAFARATSKSVDELMSLVQAERQWEAARKDPKLAERVAKYDKLKASNDAIAKSNAQNLELMLMTRSNQERMTAITQKWNQILAQAGQVFLPVLDALLAAVIPVMDIARGIAAWQLAIKAFPSLFSPIVSVFATIGQWLSSGIGKLASTFSFVGKIFGGISSIATKLFGVLGWIGKIASVFGKWIPVLGWVISAVQFVANLFGRLHGIGDAFKEGILNGILFGLKAIGLALYDTLLKPFVDAWNWIKGIFIGKSPSALGLGIVKGITSVAGMVFDALSYPWRTFLAWVLEKIPFMKKYAAIVRGGASGVIGKSVENGSMSSVVGEETITPTPAKVPGTKENQPKQDIANAVAQAENDTRTLQGILDAIKTLNDNLTSGKIGIYIDGQLMSATLARQTEFRGGYGTNKI